MIQKSAIMFIISLLVTPSPGQTAMSALSNNSLRGVKIGESGSTAEASLDTETGAKAIPRKSVENKNTSPAIDDKTRLKLFRQCQDYRNFLSFVHELSRISKTQKYAELIHTENFLSFCANFAGTSSRCQKKLFALNLQKKNDNKMDILTIHQDLFRQATLFYKLVYQYQQQHKQLPDLDQFLAQLQAGLRAIDAEYAEL